MKTVYASTHEFIIRYREYSKLPGTWDEALFSLGDWPYEDSLPEEKIENHPKKTPKWFSVHFWLRYDSGVSYDELCVRAKDYARSKLRESFPAAKLS